MTDRERLQKWLEELHRQLSRAKSDSERIIIRAKIDDVREELRTFDGGVKLTTGRGW